MQTRKRPLRFSIHFTRSRCGRIVCLNLTPLHKKACTFQGKTNRYAYEWVIVCSNASMYLWLDALKAANFYWHFCLAMPCSRCRSSCRFENCSQQDISYTMRALNGDSLFFSFFFFLFFHNRMSCLSCCITCSFFTRRLYVTGLIVSPSCSFIFNAVILFQIDYHLQACFDSAEQLSELSQFRKFTVIGKKARDQLIGSIIGIWLVEALFGNQREEKKGPGLK